MPEAAADGNFTIAMVQKTQTAASTAALRSNPTPRYAVRPEERDT